MKSRLLLLMLCCILGYTSSGQNLQQQMSSFMEKMNKAEAVHYICKVNIYYIGSKPQIQEIVYTRTAKGVYYKTDKMQFAGDQDISLMMYPDDKVIMWGKTGKEKMKTITDPNIIPLDSSFYTPDSIVDKGVSDGKRTYVLYNSRKYIQKAEFSFRISDGLLIHALYYYDPKQGAGIEKSELNFSEFDFSESQIIPVSWDNIIIYSGKNAVLKSAYANYRLIYLNN